MNQRVCSFASERTFLSPATITRSVRFLRLVLARYRSIRLTIVPSRGRHVTVRQSDI